MDIIGIHVDNSSPNAISVSVTDPVGTTLDAGETVDGRLTVGIFQAAAESSGYPFAIVIQVEESIER